MTTTSCDKYWYCGLLDKQHLRGIHNVSKYLKNELHKIFCNDFCGFHLIGENLSDLDFDIQSESYFFFCCKNYKNYIDKIKRCNIISIVLPSFSNPEPIQLDSILKFSETISDKNKRNINIGDIVKVKTGDLKNLSGIVKTITKEIATVLFYLNTSHFSEKIMTTNLMLQSNIFQYMKFPVKNK